MKRLDHYWYTRSPAMLLLTPFSLLFRGVVFLRRLAYRTGVLRSYRLPVPVIVVGNLTTGGTGKTPLVAWLVRHLQELGYRPGIVARGYGGKARQWPQQVRVDSSPESVGDEAVMLAAATGCPMAVAPDRVVAARALTSHEDCDIIVSDDGLQHYALQRDLEIAVIDGVRRFGTGFMLPAGPLREPVSRLQQVDLVVVNGLGGRGEHRMRLRVTGVTSLLDPQQTRSLHDFRHAEVHAVAGVGNPERFFRMLAEHVRTLQTHPFPDHHVFTPADIAFDDDRPVLMTHKDAVKCRYFARANWWYVRVEAEPCSELVSALDQLLAGIASRPSLAQQHGQQVHGVQDG